MSSGEANIWQPRTIIEVTADTKLVTQLLTALADQTFFTITDFAYTVGTGALQVYRNGKYLIPNVDFVEQTDTTFTVVVPSTAGDEIVAVGNTGISGTVDVRDTDIYLVNYQAIRDYAGTEDTVYAQGATTKGDAGESFFQKLTGAAPGTYVDNGITILVPTGGDGSAAWVKSIVGSSLSLYELGARPGIAADQSTVAQAAIDFCGTNGIKLSIGPDVHGNKDYQLDAGIVMAANDLTVEFVGGAYFKPVDENLLIPLTLGSTSQPSRMFIRNPSVQRASYNGATENIGIRFLEMNQCTIENPESRWSKYNLDWTASVGGHSYNTFINPQAIGGAINFRFDATASGYVNENIFLGGRGFCTADTVTNLSLLNGGSGTGHNRFYATSLEGQGVQGIYDNAGANEFHQCRPEGTWSGGFFHVMGPDCNYSLIISSRIDYSLDISGATDPRVQYITYNKGSRFSTAINGLTTLELENQSAAAGGSGLDVISHRDNADSFVWRALRKSDSLVRAFLTTTGILEVATSLRTQQSGWNFNPFKLAAHHFWVDSPQFRMKVGSAPSSATDGFAFVQAQDSVDIGLGGIGNIVNTSGKYMGKMVWDATTDRPVWAFGPAAGDIWVYSDGTTAYTPT